MSKRPDRSWEANVGPSKRPSSWKDQLALAHAVLEAPSVTLDGIRYWSDRFYLHHVEGDSLPCNSESGGCTCGCKQAPPLFHRERFVQSLDLKAAVLGTFVMDTQWMMECFPNLVGPQATVPTLIVHGDKKFTTRVRRREEHTAEESDDDETSSLPSWSFLESSQEKGLNLQHSSPSVMPQCQEASMAQPPSRDDARSTKKIPVVDFSSTTGLNVVEAKVESQGETSSSSDGAAGLSLHTQQDSVSTAAVPAVPSANGVDSASPEATKPRNAFQASALGAPPKPTVTPEAATTSAAMNMDMGKHCYFTRVLSAWKKPNENSNKRVSVESSVALKKKESEAAASKLESKRGVYHPKFMILFESSGDVVVVVSTANLTRTRTIEGSWIQRFRPNRRYQQQQERLRRQPASSTTNGKRSAKSSPVPSVKNTNDFGVVLQDFLQKLDDSVLSGDLQIRDFFQKHLEFPLEELAQSFYFEKAQVHLVPVIPGDFETNSSKKPKSESKCTHQTTSPRYYGRHRVQYILQQQTLVQSGNDRLIMQPTSLGGNWKRGELADVVRSYLNVRPTRDGGGDESDDGTLDYWDEEGLLDRMDIVWPSRDFIHKANGLEYDEGNPDEASQQDDPHSSFVFLSSQAFNSIDRDCVARMTRFRESEPAQRPSTLVPHFKSIGRLVTKHSAVRKHGFQTSSAQEYLSWFLLTSACLSHGAQGKKVVEADPFNTTKESVQYANFELGVLFTSRIQQREKRLYTFAPNGCSCQSLDDPQQKTIHLPIPYSLRPKPYFGNEDDDVMQETPFIHEIEDGTRCVGNMLLTPYGIQQAEKQRMRSKMMSKAS